LGAGPELEFPHAAAIKLNAPRPSAITANFPSADLGRFFDRFSAEVRSPRSISRSSLTDGLQNPPPSAASYASGSNPRQVTLQALTRNGPGHGPSTTNAPRQQLTMIGARVSARIRAYEELKRYLRLPTSRRFHAPGATGNRRPRSGRRRSQTVRAEPVLNGPEPARRGAPQRVAAANLTLVRAIATLVHG
jgi:hypothetical protein